MPSRRSIPETLLRSVFMNNHYLQIWNQLRRLVPCHQNAPSESRHGSSRSEQGQTYPVAQILPEEVLHQVLRLLSEEESDEDLVTEPGYPYFGTGCLSCIKSPDPVLKVALVCWHWYYAALPLIYAHCKISPTASLKLLYRTLTSSADMPSRIRTLSNSRIYSHSAEWEDPKFERSKSLEKALAQLCRVLPQTAEMDIEICAISLPRLSASVAARGMSSPHLRSLTIETGILTNQTVWPSMPQLRFLRIKRSLERERSAGFFASDFTGLPPLVRIELIKAYFELRDDRDRDILSSGELKAGIQDLVVVDSSLPSFNLFPSAPMSHWASLRRLTLATDRWPMAGHPTISLPNLEALTMMQLVRDEVTFPYVWDDAGSMFDSLVPLLSEVHLAPSLKVVRLRCWRETWNSADSHKFQSITSERSIHLEVRIIEGVFARLSGINSSNLMGDQTSERMKGYLGFLIRAQIHD